MGRLIDDIALKASIDANEILETNKPLEDIIDEQSTAYDIEAVVKQIEEWNKVTGAFPEHSTWYYELISIIEGGGVNASE